METRCFGGKINGVYNGLAFRKVLDMMHLFGCGFTFLLFGFFIAIFIIYMADAEQTFSYWILANAFVITGISMVVLGLTKLHNKNECL